MGKSSPKKESTGMYVFCFVVSYTYGWDLNEVAHQKKKKDLGRKKRYYISWLVEHLFCKSGSSFHSFVNNCSAKKVLKGLPAKMTG